jgi:hypothetical protein
MFAARPAFFSVHKHPALPLLPCIRLPALPACPSADSKLSETRMLQFQWGAHQLANKIFAGKAGRENGGKGD